MKPTCKSPFERIQIETNGDVFFCCSNFCKRYSIGNIFTDEIDDIWYGEKAIEFRKSILDGSYKYCNLSICGNFYEESLYDSTTLTPPYPKVVNLGYSRSCNVRCVTCRDKLIVETKEETKRLDAITDKIVFLCKNCELVRLNGGGELFTSPHFKSLVKKLIETYPNLKFHIFTNGILCDEYHIKEYNLENRIDNIVVSVHSAKKETYESIVRGGKWEQLLKTSKYLSSLKGNFQMGFTIFSKNYKEMPAFVKMANKFNAFPLFWVLQKWEDSEMFNNYEKYTCWKPTHPEYKDFLKVLNKLKRMKNYRYVLTEELLRILQAQTVDPWWVRMGKFFKR